MIFSILQFYEKLFSFFQLNKSYSVIILNMSVLIFFWKYKNIILKGVEWA